METILFADDANLFVTGKDPANIIDIANIDLKIFHSWCLSNRLTVNLNKTYFMMFSNKQTDALPPLNLHHSIINRTKQHTFLGIIYDDAMSFKPHITNLILKLSRIVSLLYQAKQFMPLYVLRLMYNAHITYTYNTVHLSGATHIQHTFCLSLDSKRKL